VKREGKRKEERIRKVIEGINIIKYTICMYGNVIMKLLFMMHNF
jgi:hypothetical protein